MFERFTHDARSTVVNAQEAARRLGDDYIGSEHLLLGAACAPGSVAAQALDRLGIGPEEVERAVRRLPRDGLDAEALAAVGIDLADIRDRAEATFGPGAFDDAATHGSRRRGRPRGHIPFDGHAKKTLEIALREAVHLKNSHIDSGHILLAIARLEQTPAHRALLALPATPHAVRQAVIEVWVAAAQRRAM